MKAKFKRADRIKRIFTWEAVEIRGGGEIGECYLELALEDTDFIFIAWGNEARMELTDVDGGSPFIHYYSPKRYAAAVVEFVELCQEHFGDDWLDRGG